MQQGIRWAYAEFAAGVTRLTRALEVRTVEMREKGVAELGLVAEE